MKIEIEITRQDYLNFNVYYFMKTQFTRTLLICLAGLLVLQFAINKDRSYLNLVEIIISSLFYLVFYFVIIYYSLHKTKSIPKEGGACLGIKVYEFGDDKIFYKDKDRKANSFGVRSRI